MGKRKVERIPAFHMVDGGAKGIKLNRLDPDTPVSGDHSVAFPHRDEHYMLVVIEEGKLSGNIDFVELNTTALFCCWYSRDKFTCFHPGCRSRAGFLILIPL
jgi:AraC family transcriptional regulator, transcriptional activator of pobA